MEVSKHNRHRMTGVTLVEVLLVLTIAGSLTMLGLRFFQGYQLDSTAQQVRANVESLMRSGANYYYANCKNSDSNPNATLDPTTNYTRTLYAVPLATLITNKFVEREPPLNPLTDSTTYIVQFNRLPITTKYYCTDRSNQATCSPIGSSFNWTVQVAVKVNDVTKADQLLKLTGADCLTTGNGTTVFPCSSAAATSALCQNYRNMPHIPWFNFMAFQSIADNMGCPPSGTANSYNNYLSWEKLPSMVSPKSQSILWMSNPVVRQYKQDMESPSLNTLINDPTTRSTARFLCGS